ncbi:MAG: hypothetical protein R3B90_03450 [Planctomycetaceae bacterium]
MNTLFPGGFPLPTAFYLTLYVLTLALHVVFMNYVLAGSAYVMCSVWRARRSLIREGAAVNDDQLARTITDWLPLMLSLAITAGIAPLLFIQILYRVRFYTANLLLFHRWMAILPVLIAGFYLLYLLKKVRTSERPWLPRLTTMAILGCFGFVGWSWTENHLLSLESQAVWTRQYVRHSLFFNSPELWPRLLTWLCGSFAHMAIILMWQWRWGTLPVDSDITAMQTMRRLSTIALGGLTCAVGTGLWYVSTLPTLERGLLMSPLAGPWFAVACTGVAVQVLGWVIGRRAGRPKLSTLIPLTTGGLLTIVGVAVVRESLRLSRVDISTLYEAHASAYTIDGFAAFVAFAVLSGLLVAWCLKATVRGAGSWSGALRSQFGLKVPIASQHVSRYCERRTLMR